MEKEKGKTKQRDTDNNEDTDKTQSNRKTSSDQLSNEEGAPVEKRGRGRPRKLAQIIIGSKDMEGEMEEEDVFHTPTVQSAFRFSQKEVREYRDKSKNKTNSISEPKETEDNVDNDPEKTKKGGREIFPCVVCERNVCRC